MVYLYCKSLYCK